jgi:ComF family protein
MNSPILKNFLKLFLQPCCPLCQRSASSEFCPSCSKQLRKCQLPQPKYLWKPPLPIFGWGEYQGSLKRAIASLKYDNHPEIAYPLGRWLGEAWLENSPTHPKPVVVPIPLHPNKLKQRGFNQAALIAKSFCETTGCKFKPNGLQRIRETEAQFSLSATQRDKNLQAAFQLGRDFRHLPQVPILLVDDIYTTGATAKSASIILEQNQIQVLGLAAAAIVCPD